MVRLKSLEGSDGTALALLSNDVNASVALCRDLLGSHCAAAAFVYTEADEAASAVASHLDRVLFCSAPAPAAAEAAKPSLLQLQRCLDNSERLRSHGGAIMPATVADAMKSCRRAVPLLCYIFAASNGACSAFASRRWQTWRKLQRKGCLCWIS